MTYITFIPFVSQYHIFNGENNFMDIAKKTLDTRYKMAILNNVVKCNDYRSYMHKKFLNEGGEDINKQEQQGKFAAR